MNRSTPKSGESASRNVPSRQQQPVPDQHPERSQSAQPVQASDPRCITGMAIDLGPGNLVLHCVPRRSARASPTARRHRRPPSAASRALSRTRAAHEDCASECPQCRFQPASTAQPNSAAEASSQRQRLPAKLRYDGDLVGRTVVELPELRADMGDHGHRRVARAEGARMQVEADALDQRVAGLRAGDAQHGEAVALVAHGRKGADGIGQLAGEVAAVLGHRQPLAGAGPDDGEAALLHPLRRRPAGPGHNESGPRRRERRPGPCGRSPWPGPDRRAGGR